MSARYTSAAYRELGGMLRRARVNAGLSSEALAKKLGWPLPTISRMENGRRSSTTTDVIQYAVMCGMKAPECKPLVEFTRMAELKLGYHLSDKRIDGPLQSLIFHEASAAHTTFYDPQVINGLLQTPRYARSLITALNPEIDEDRVAGAIRTRLERRRILSVPNPPHSTFYMTEQAMRLRVGSDEIMHEQLLHIVLTAALDNVSVRIVPSTAAERFAMSGAFHLMEFQEHRPIVYLDHLGGGGLILEDLDYTCSYRELVPKLAGVALDEGESRQCAAEVADAYDRGSLRRVADIVAEEQLQRRRRLSLYRSGVVEPPTPIYE